MVVLKYRFGVFHFERMWCVEMTYFEQFSHWKDVVVLKGLILDSFYLGRVWWV